MTKLHVTQAVISSILEENEINFEVTSSYMRIIGGTPEPITERNIVAKSISKQISNIDSEDIESKMLNY